MNHIVDMCPLTKFQGRLKLLHQTGDDAVIYGWNHNGLSSAMQIAVMASQDFTFLTHNESQV